MRYAHCSTLLVAANGRAMQSAVMVNTGGFCAADFCFPIVTPLFNQAGRPSMRRGATHRRPATEELPPAWKIKTGYRSEFCTHFQLSRERFAVNSRELA